jgi:hypothetical protein
MDDKAIRIARRNKFAAAVLLGLALPIQAYGLLSQGRISLLWIGLTVVAVTTYAKCDRTIKSHEVRVTRQAPPPPVPPSYDFFGGPS